jgi:hypothetical protein
VRTSMLVVGTMASATVCVPAKWPTNGKSVCPRVVRLGWMLALVVGATSLAKCWVGEPLAFEVCDEVPEGNGLVVVTH